MRKWNNRSRILSQRIIIFKSSDCGRGMKFFLISFPFEFLKEEFNYFLLKNVTLQEKIKLMYRNKVYKTHATQAISLLISSESNQIEQIHFHVVSTTQRTINVFQWIVQSYCSYDLVKYLARYLVPWKDREQEENKIILNFVFLSIPLWVYRFRNFKEFSFFV